MNFSPLGVEVVEVEDTQLELTFSPQQIDTTIPSSMIIVHKQWLSIVKMKL